MATWSCTTLLQAKRVGGHIQEENAKRSWQISRGDDKDILIIVEREMRERESITDKDPFSFHFLVSVEITYTCTCTWPRWNVDIFYVWYIVTFVIPSRPEPFLIIYIFEIISIIKHKSGTMYLFVRFICLMQGWGNIDLKRSVPLGIPRLSLHTRLELHCWLSTREIMKTFWLHTRNQEWGFLEKQHGKNTQLYEH